MVDKNPIGLRDDVLDSDWSADSRWLTYAKQKTNLLRAIYLYSVETREKHQISDGMSDTGPSTGKGCCCPAGGVKEKSAQAVQTSSRSQVQTGILIFSLIGYTGDLSQFFVPFLIIFGRVSVVWDF